MEGSLTLIYHFINLFKNLSKQEIPKELVWKWIDYLQNTINPQQNEDNEDESFDENRQM